MSVQMSEKDLLELVKQLDKQVELTALEHMSETLGEEKERAGMAAVKQNVITVIDPDEHGANAKVRPIKPVIIKVNGDIISGDCTVTSKDTIEWEIESSPLFTIGISEDKMKVTLQIHSCNEYAWKLHDSDFSALLKVRARPDKGIVLRSISFADIIQEIQHLGINASLDTPAIINEMKQPGLNPVVIARGKEAKPGKDARLEVYFNENVENVLQEVRGMIDFRNHLHIPSVANGDLIGQKIPSVEGEIGYDVYGSPVLPEPPADITVVGKESVEITPDWKIIALREGRPRVTGTKVKTVDISTSYVVPGNVDLKTGNIVFSGDVVVYGDITESMIVESLGNVYVLGNVFGATVTATGSIKVKGNIIKSNMYSGYYGVIFNRLYQNCRLLLEQMEALFTAANTLANLTKSKKQNVNIGSIVLILLEQKFKEIPQIIRDLLSVISNVQHINKKELHGLRTKLLWFLTPTNLYGLNSMDRVIELRNDVQVTFDSIARMQETNVQIDINQCHLSTLKSNGDILIRREGVLQSDLLASGSIVFYDDQSVCRGSRLDAGMTISAMVVGGQTSVDTFLKAGRRIVVKKMLSGKICVGKKVKEIFSPIGETTFDVMGM